MERLQQFRKTNFLYLIILSISIAGCGPNRVGLLKKSLRNVEKTSNTIKIGDDQEATVKKLETAMQPYNNRFEKRDLTSIHLKSGKSYQVYFVRNAIYPDGLDTDDEYLPFVFSKGKLIGVGWERLGGPKTHYSPELVQYHYQLQWQRAQALQDFGSSLQQAGMQLKQLGM